MISCLRMTDFSRRSILSNLAVLLSIAILTTSRGEDSSEKSPGSDVVLSLDKQKVIWDGEHCAFLIETHFGKPLLSELREQKLESVRHRCCDDFSGSVLQRTQPQPKTAGNVTEINFPKGSETRAVNPDEFCEALLKRFAGFSEIKQTGLRALKTKSVEDGKVWTCRLMISVSGIAADGRMYESVSEHDVDFQVSADDDFKKDLQEKPVILRWKDVKEANRYSENLLLTEVTAGAGLNRFSLPDNWINTEYSEQYWFQFGVHDFNLDGVNDIAVATTEGRILLLSSLNGQPFADYAQQLGIASHPHPTKNFTFLVSWIDYDNDGFADLFAGDRLFHNEGGKYFVDVTIPSGIRVPFLAMGATVADFDCDGLPDLYVCAQRPSSVSGKSSKPASWVGDHENGGINQLWRNLGDGRFENIAKKAGATGGRRKSFAASAFFYDDDHFPDLYIANDFGENVMLRNRGDGTFEDITKPTGTGDFATSMGVCAGDIDNDGKAELYVANMFSKMGRRIIANVSEADYPPGIYQQIKGSCAGNRLYQLREGETVYRELSEDLHVNKVGWAYAPAMGDFNRDGWLDLYATTGFLSRNRGKPDG
ncbi:MAG: VCBS repeat-containing protein [Verrucomicrobiales bacterium]|nr:VCBS repeat-containing protein [Verrucomicrobiales bacterium]